VIFVIGDTCLSKSWGGKAGTGHCSGSETNGDLCRLGDSDARRGGFPATTVPLPP
jgi:hypothetical protein